MRITIKLIYSITLMVLAAALTLSSCTENFLELDRPSVYTAETFYTTSEQAYQGLIGCYNSLQKEASLEAMARFGDFRTDDTDPGGDPKTDESGQNELANYVIYSDNSMVSGLWTDAYYSINIINRYLEGVSKLDNNPLVSNEVKLYKAEARFIRAYWFAILVKHWGGVPLMDHVLKEDQWFKQSRASEETIYQFIFSELRDIIPLLNESQTNDQVGRITKWAAKGLLSRSLLYYVKTDASNLAIWQEIYNLSSDVANNYNSGKLDGFSPVWFDELSTESIFELILKLEENEKFSFAHWTSPRYFFDKNGNVKEAKGIGWGLNTVTENLANQFGYAAGMDSLQRFALADERGIYTFWTRWDRMSYVEDPITSRGGVVDELALNVATSKFDTYNDNGMYYSRKFSRNLASSDYNIGRNVPLIRHAEMYLIYAEAAFYLGKETEALQAVNKVRERAFRKAIKDGRTTLNNISIASSGQQLLKDIWQEKRLEMATEGHRFFELVRTNRLGEVVLADKPSIPFLEFKHKLLPIPISEIQKVPSLVQNPGY